MKTLFKSCSLITFLIFSTSFKISYGNLPDFSKYKDIKQKKERFFNYLSPMINEVNSDILKTREKLTAILKKEKKSPDDNLWAAKIANDYDIQKWDINSKVKQSELMKKVDIVPTPLVLAQAANESAWGTSRFAQKGNNLFGQWCFTKGCGIIPKERPSGKSYSVRRFDSIKSSIKSYVFNLNTNHHYEYFRKLRSKLRLEDKKLNSLILAQGLTNYSTRKQAYVAEIKQMISSNNLQNRYN